MKLGLWQRLSNWMRRPRSTRLFLITFATSHPLACKILVYAGAKNRLDRFGIFWIDQHDRFHFCANPDGETVTASKAISSDVVVEMEERLRASLRDLRAEDCLPFMSREIEILCWLNSQREEQLFCLPKSVVSEREGLKEVLEQLYGMARRRR